MSGGPRRSLRRRDGSGGLRRQISSEGFHPGESGRRDDLAIAERAGEQRQNHALPGGDGDRDAGHTVRQFLGELGPQGNSIGERTNTLSRSRSCARSQALHRMQNERRRAGVLHEIATTVSPCMRFRSAMLRIHNIVLALPTQNASARNSRMGLKFSQDTVGKGDVRFRHVINMASLEAPE